MTFQLEDPKLQFMESSLLSLSQAELRLAQDLHLYRDTMTPLIHAAAQRLCCGGSHAYLIRQLLADSYHAENAMKLCVRHACLAYESGKALKRTLS